MTAKEDAKQEGPCVVSSFEHLGVAGAVELHHLLNVLIDEVELAVDALKSGKTLAL